MEEQVTAGVASQPAPPPEATLERTSLAKQIPNMSVNEKIKLALVGDMEARRLLLRESNRQIQSAVLENERITESEIITIANSRSVHDDLLRHIANTREWAKLYPVRLALVKNPKTPCAIALKLTPSLNAADLKIICKSKSVAPAVANAAKRALLKDK
jgi:hypothetical protein